MLFHPRIVYSVLLSLALLLTGCQAFHRPDRDGPIDLLFSIVAPTARTVAIAGSFNRWDPSSHYLSGPDRSGRWTVTVPLPPGHYEYLFIINGTEWVPDAAASSVDNGLGGRNSVVTVAGDREGGK